MLRGRGVRSRPIFWHRGGSCDGREYFAECGKLSRGNLQKIKCGTFRKLPIITFPHSAAEKFRISADHKTTVCSHCTTDVQPMHTSVRRPRILSFRILCGPFGKEQRSCFTISTNFKVSSAFQVSCHFASGCDWFQSV